MILVQNTWSTFTDVYETFSIKIPGEISLTQDKFMTNIGEIEVITYQCNPPEEDPNLRYVLQEYDYPDNYFPQDSVELIRRVLETSMEEMASKMSGKVDYSSSIEKDGYQGILFRISNSKTKIIMKSKTYIVDGTYYSLQVYCKKNNGLNDEIDFFLDSFIILED